MKADGIISKGAIVPETRRVIFLGDSITDYGLYIAFMDAYFFQHMPEKNLTLINLGLSSETASGLCESGHPFPRSCIHDRLDKALKESKPEWVLFCYGMNDAIYLPFSEERFSSYKKGILELVEKIENTGAKALALTPPPFDAYSTGSGGSEQNGYEGPFRGYNDVMERYSQFIKDELAGRVAKVIDIYSPILCYIDEQRQNNPEYVYGDGIHPDRGAHWIIARELLRELFNICLDRVPDYVDHPEESSFFRLVMERHTILGPAWKEHVGHTNPCKAQVLPLDEASAQSAVLETRIRCMAKENDLDFDLKSTQWNGFERHDFYLHGREAILVKPEKPDAGMRWVWRAEFFGAFPQADLELLKKGWHLAYYRISNLFGCPEAVELMKGFHGYVVNTYGLCEKSVLFGFSRGGLYAFNYAARYPCDVSALYLDAPVLDIRSWPGGKGAGIGSAPDWEQCMAVYGLTEDTARNFDGNPLDFVRQVVQADIPIIVVAGDSDNVVPLAENSAILEKLCKEMNGRIKMIVKPGVGHHPHSLENPGPVIDFLIENTSK